MGGKCKTYPNMLNLHALIKLLYAYYFVQR